MDNVYQPPQANLSLRGNTITGSFSIMRAFQLSSAAFGEKTGLAVGLTLLFALVLGGSLFAAAIGLFIPIIGWIATFVIVVFLVPILTASVPIVGYRFIRREAAVSDFFICFRSYGSVLLALLAISILSIAVSFPLSLPQFLFLFEGFPLGGEQWSERFSAWSTLSAARQNDLYATENLWRVALAYLYYPLSLYISTRLQLVVPLIVLKQSSIFDAFKGSWIITQSQHLKLWWFYFLTALIAFAGALACGIGLIVALPYAMMLQGSSFYQLFGEDQPEATDA